MLKNRRFTFNLNEATLLLHEIEHPESIKITEYPYKDIYMPLLLYKYSSHPQKVLKMMNFIYNDLTRYLPKDSQINVRGLNKMQLTSLRNFIQLVESSNSLDQDDIWNHILKIFKLTLHERFNESEIKLFKMCLDCLNQKAG